MDIQKSESQIKILRDHMTFLCVSHCSQGTQQDTKIEQINQCKGQYERTYSIVFLSPVTTL